LGVRTTELFFINRDDPLYRQELALRYEILRRPLGFPPGSERFEFEEEALHLVAVQHGAVVGCVLFHRENPDAGRLLQMAVRHSLRRSGLGTWLVQHLERHVERQGIGKIQLHARAHVQAFYASLGYTPISDPYQEVGIPHVTMTKRVTPSAD